MVFNSYTFVVFFVALMFAMRMTLSWRSKKLVLLIASYLFYAAWNPPFIVLIWISTLADWFISKRIAASNSVANRKSLVVLSLLVNLGLLGYYKYGNFILENFVTTINGLGIPYQPAPFDVILPVGISFYTFQTLSYTLDIYRGQLKPWPSFLDYALFVTFFPQLVAGPIVRAREFLPQTVSEPRPTSAQMGWGLTLMVVGLFEKVVLADGLLAPVVEKVYDTTQSLSASAAGIGTLAFAGQIFCDFAGYSTIAIGAAMVLGFSLPDNFRFPYGAIGFSDFWRRWHISLSSWLRDYLYISLGGNHGGTVNTYKNLLLTMLLGGLWHGASWNFVIWGGLHGTYLIGERLVSRAVGHWSIWSTWLGRTTLAGLTFGLVCFAWIFFRAPTLDRSVDIVKSLAFVGPQDLFLSAADEVIVIFVSGVLLLGHAFLRNTSIEDAAKRIPPLFRSTLIGLMLLAIFNSPGEDRAFIYFQF